VVPHFYGPSNLIQYILVRTVRDRCYAVLRIPSNVDKYHLLERDTKDQEAREQWQVCSEPYLRRAIATTHRVLYLMVVLCVEVNHMHHVADLSAEHDDDGVRPVRGSLT
jgi:hypothetical protein